MEDICDALQMLYARVLLLGLWSISQRRESPWTFEISVEELP